MRHYAGDVVYHTAKIVEQTTKAAEVSWLEKNNDPNPNPNPHPNPNLTLTLALTSSGLSVSSASERTNERCTPSARCSPAHWMQSAVAYVTEHHRSSAHLARVRLARG